MNEHGLGEGRVWCKATDWEASCLGAWVGAGALWRRDAGQDSTSIIPAGEEPASSDTRQTYKARRDFVTTSGVTMFGLSLPMHRHLQAR